MKTVADIIDELGGNAAVARNLGVKASRISEIKRRNSLPPGFFRPIVSLAQEKGLDWVTADLLADLHAGLVAGE